jgi:hypothetical protein
MKKNLILLVALFLMQMVSGVTPTKVPYFQLHNSLNSNIADSVKIGCSFNYIKNSTSTTSFVLKVKKIGFFYKIGNKPGYSGSKRPPSPDEIDHLSPDENDQVSPVEVDHLI